MSTGVAIRRRRRPVNVLLGLVLLGTIGAVLVLLGPGLLSGFRAEGGSLLGGSECVVQTSEGEIELSGSPWFVVKAGFVS